MTDCEAIAQIEAKVYWQDLQEALDMYWELRNGPILPEEALEMVLKRFA